jgi:hypothetical protein
VEAADARAYADSRARIIELVRDLDEDALETHDWDGDPTPYLQRWVSGGAFEWPASP